MEKGSRRVKARGSASKQDVLSKQVGAKIDAELWKQLRVLAIEQGTTATRLLNDAMREYISRHKGGGVFFSTRLEENL